MEGFRYNKKTLHALERLVRHLGYALRYERGSFRPGYCILQEKKVVVINRFYGLEARINSLMEILTALKPTGDGLDEAERQLLEKVTSQIAFS